MDLLWNSTGLCFRKTHSGRCDWKWGLRVRKTVLPCLPVRSRTLHRYAVKRKRGGKGGLNSSSSWRLSVFSPEQCPTSACQRQEEWRGNSAALIIVEIVYGKPNKRASASAACQLSAPAGVLNVKLSWWSSEAPSGQDGWARRTSLLLEITVFDVNQPAG